MDRNRLGTGRRYRANSFGDLRLAVFREAEVARILEVALGDNLDPTPPVCSFYTALALFSDSPIIRRTSLSGRMDVGSESGKFSGSPLTTVRHAVDDHPLMQPADGAASGPDAEERKNGMQQTGKPCAQHRAPERTGDHEMLAITLAD